MADESFIEDVESAPPGTGSDVEVPWRLLAALLLVSLIVVFAVQNTQDVELRFLAWEWRLPLVIVILVAVTGTVNSRKSDSTPADWLPDDPGRHCFYAARYLTAAVAYGLPVTEADHRALAGAVRRCPG